MISHVDQWICSVENEPAVTVASRVCLLAMAAARLPLAAVAVAAQLVLGVGGGWWGSSDSSADSSAEPQHQVAWEELRRELEATAAAPLDESVLPLFRKMDADSNGAWTKSSFPGAASPCNPPAERVPGARLGPGQAS